MKNQLIIFLFLLVSLPAFSQVAKVQNKPGYDYKWIHFGFMVGVNQMDFGFERQWSDTSYFADVSSPKPGFQVSIVSDLRMGDHLSLRFLPGITFGSREFSFYDEDGLARTTQVESNFLDFPLLVKYKSKRVNNYRPYLIAGTSLRYDMASRKAYDANEAFIRLLPLDVYVEFGFGIDFFLQYFKFAPELKVSAGFRDVKVDEFDHYGNSIKKLNSYLVMLCFYFE